MVKDAVEEAGTGCNNYMDNTLARSANKEEHIVLLEKIFASYHSHGLFMNLKKSKYFQQSVDFLGLNFL